MVASPRTLIPIEGKVPLVEIVSAVADSIVWLPDPHNQDIVLRVFNNKRIK